MVDFYYYLQLNANNINIFLIYWAKHFNFLFLPMLLYHFFSFLRALMCLPLKCGSKAFCPHSTSLTTKTTRYDCNAQLGWSYMLPYSLHASLCDLIYHYCWLNYQYTILMSAVQAQASILHSGASICWTVTLGCTIDTSISIKLKRLYHLLTSPDIFYFSWYHQ